MAPRACALRASVHTHKILFIAKILKLIYFLSSDRLSADDSGQMEKKRLLKMQ